MWERNLNAELDPRNRRSMSYLALRASKTICSTSVLTGDPLSTDILEMPQEPGRGIKLDD